jgi:hypothetical protein
VTPGVVGDGLGGGEEVVFALVVEAFSILVDQDPVVLAPDDGWAKCFNATRPALPAFSAASRKLNVAVEPAKPLPMTTIA